MRPGALPLTYRPAIICQSMSRKQGDAGDDDEGGPEAPREPLASLKQHATNLDQDVDLDSDSDRESDYPDDGSESSHFDSDDEDDAPNLFECANTTLQGDVMVLQDICSTDECKRTFSSRSECMNHIRCCPATMSQSTRVRADPVLPVAEEDLENCPYCPQRFLRATSLQLHIEACHAEQNQTCLHEDCQAISDVFTPWALNLHHFEAHDAMACHCPFPKCTFRSMTKGGQAPRRVSLIRHLNRRHALVTDSFATLQNLDLKEVIGRTNMTDQNITYIDICADAAIPSSTLPMPAALTEDCQSVGARRNPSCGPAGIYEQLRSQAVFRREEGIYDYNLSRLASLGYDGMLHYRQGVRCVGAWDTLSCVSSKTINLRNTIVTSTARRSPNGVLQKTMTLRAQDVCDTPDCGNPLAMGTHLCWSHALNAVDIAVLRSPIRTAVEQNMNRRANCDIRTPDEAARWFADEKTTFLGISNEEIQFHDQLRDRRGVFATDVETVGPLLIQAAMVDADRNVVFGGYIHHSCATVKEVWDLAIKTCGRPLVARESSALRKAFGSPSMHKPRGYSMHWLVNELKALKMKYPDICMAEWATHPFDQVVYLNNINRAGYNPADVLPAPENWVSPMQWFQKTGPTLPGYQLAYVASLYHPSDLVFKWHDAIVDAMMLMDILSTRQQKYHHRKVEVPPYSPSILSLFDQGRTNAISHGDYLIQRPWSAREERLCWLFLQDKVREYEFASHVALYRAASYHLLQHNFFRTSFSVDQHLKVMARRAQLEDEYVTYASRQAQALLMSTYDALSAPRSILKQIALPQPNINPAATLLVQQICGEIPVETRCGHAFWPRCRNGAHALNKSTGSACSEQEIDLALLVMMNGRTNRLCKGCGAAIPSVCFTKICRSCERHVDGLDLLACVEEGCNADRVEGFKRCMKCVRKRHYERAPGKNGDNIEEVGGGADQIQSKDIAKVANGNFQLGVVNNRKRDQDDEDEDDNNPNPCKKQKRPDESEQSPEYCNEGCGNLKQGKSLRCADCARELRNKKARVYTKKRRDEARAAKTCEEENCTRPPEGLSSRCAECRQKRKDEGRLKRTKKTTANAQKSRETGVPLGECRKCKEPHFSEKGLCPPCLRAHKAQRRREKRREDGLETNCVEDGCEREIVPGRARCAECLERVKPICERCNGEGRPGLARCQPCQRVVDKESQKRRDERRRLLKRQAAVQSADVEEDSLR
ncbi:hypothetical protein B0J15DRAFT_539033 [Fusarium solani]|uniref:C2H2-type domain-containing protein n=1 Tax=Fusarium solani TaxID=169388 RepID=A0A9P9G815_FUSSL|nr:uncharacterized protein B0J15DRAFT_539033 [Fusarium solani]KAH7234066.1 hypothetical protein B0J15DRAFT_539033 [Fusarium solani]